MMELEALQDIDSEIRALGAQIVASCPRDCSLRASAVIGFRWPTTGRLTKPIFMAALSSCFSLITGTGRLSTLWTESGRPCAKGVHPPRLLNRVGLGERDHVRGDAGFALRVG